MRPLFVLIVLTICLQSSAQLSSTEVEWLPPAVGDKKWKPLLGFDSRRSFFNDRNVKFLGLRMGAQHRGVHRFGLGVYSMSQGETYSGIEVDRPDAATNTLVRFDAGFATLFYERVIMQAGLWELAVPLYLGGGSLRGSYKDVLGLYKPYLDESFSVFGAGVTVKYRLLPWLEPGIGGGYRSVYDTNREVSKTLQQPYYTFKVSILLGELYHHLKDGL